jgi:predicted small secreted protein
MRARSIRLSVLVSLAAATLAACTTTSGGGRGGSPMGFFVTSTGLGKGADLGGLKGADAHCQKLAQSAGAGHRKWRAYLSNAPEVGTQAIHARDRIGKGPWRNAKGELIASTVDDLHGSGNNINKQTALSEKGEMIKGRGDSPNEHDILTGSLPDGRAAELTCNNWTSGGGGAAIVGHHDRMGLNDLPPAKSWNSSHPSRGCSQDDLRATGGAGLFYCFAAD